ncbi:MAG: ornithine cyclodeaminase family protein [Solirubrobacterales bacterium]|nr:ornithine cyclodeaminase family protein [Solirubrobacterales bacterium]
MRVLILNHDDVIASLPPATCAEGMASILAAHARGEAYMPLRSMMMPPAAAGFMGLMPAWRDGRYGHRAAFALKAICVMPANPARGLDAHQGTVTLFDGDTGVPTAILDASAITAIRTAAVTAVATRLLARPGASVLAIIGAGVQARTHIDALLRVRGFESVRVYAPTEAHARAVVEDAAAARPAGIEFRVCESAQDVVRGADVVVTATSSREPVLEREWVGAGAHINAVGASTPAARELDTDTVAASALFCDSRESLRNEAGEFQLAVREGKIAGDDHIRAELGEVLAGLLPGRQDDAELTVFRSLGLAVEDLAAAEEAVTAARGRGLGREIEL